MGALVKAVQEVAKELNCPTPRIEMSPPSHQPKIDVLKKIYAEGADVVVLGNGRYPANALGNVATYVVSVYVCVCVVCLCLLSPFSVLEQEVGGPGSKVPEVFISRQT